VKNFWKTFSGFLPWRIWQQLFAVMVVLVVVPLVVLGALLIHTSQQAVRVSVLRDNQEIAVRAAQEIEQVIQSPRAMLNTTAAILGVLHGDIWRQETVLVELALRQPIFTRVAVVDLRGKELASSALGEPLRERAGDQAFLQAKTGEEYLSEVTFAVNHLPVMTMSTPIRKLNKIVGVLAAEVNLRGVWDIVDGIQIGKTGRASVVAANGRFIAHPDKKKVLQDGGFVVPQSLLDRNSSWEQPVAAKESRLVAYSPVPSLKGGLVIFQSAFEAYAFSKIMRTQAWVLIFVSILATVLISLGLARFISRPVSALVDGTRRVARGDFDQNLRVNRRDELGELLDAFNAMTAKLKDVQRMEKLSIIGRAATTIAHELKNSLTLVHTYIQMLPVRYKDRKFIEDFSRIVPQELESWKAMLKNMTDYAQVSRFAMSQVDIHSMLSEVALLAGERARQKQINFIFRDGQNLPTVRGNQEKLKQVILNLLSNAFEAAAAGGSVIMSVDSQTAGTEPLVLIRVEDNGKGIPAVILGRIFDPFFTTRNDGLGLGLAISKDIVLSHDGRLEVSSMPGKTVFTIKLPVRAPLGQKG